MSIESIHVTTSTGLFAPFTPSGRIVVNNVLASVFISLLDDSPSLTVVAGFDVNFHWIAHSFEFPHRLMCHYISSCPRETYTQEGLSNWIALPLKVALRMLQWPTILLNSFVGIVLLIFAFFDVCFRFPLMTINLITILFLCKSKATREK